MKRWVLTALFALAGAAWASGKAKVARIVRPVMANRREATVIWA